jgi:hypothetical protein
MELPDFPWNKAECWTCLDGELQNGHEVWCDGEKVSMARVAFDDLWVEDLETRHETLDSIKKMVLKLLGKASAAIVMRELELRELRGRLEARQ